MACELASYFDREEPGPMEPASPLRGPCEPTPRNVRCPGDPQSLAAVDVTSGLEGVEAKRSGGEGPAEMTDRSSRPHRQVNRTPVPRVRKIVHVRLKQRLGSTRDRRPTRSAALSVHAVLVRCGTERLTRIDRVTSEPIRRRLAVRGRSPKPR